jgi:hypothetical protein
MERGVYLEARDESIHFYICNNVLCNPRAQTWSSGLAAGALPLRSLPTARKADVSQLRIPSCRGSNDRYPSDRNTYAAFRCSGCHTPIQKVRGTMPVPHPAGPGAAAHPCLLIPFLPLDEAPFAALTPGCWLGTPC